MIDKWWANYVSNSSKCLSNFGLSFLAEVGRTDYQWSKWANQLMNVFLFNILKTRQQHIHLVSHTSMSITITSSNPGHTYEETWININTGYFKCKFVWLMITYSSYKNALVADNGARKQCRQNTCNRGTW